MRHRFCVLLLAATLPTIACEGPRETGEDGETPPTAGAMEGTEARPGTPGEATLEPALPDTTAAAVWSFLQDASYADEWRTWPGKEALYPGTEPHGMLLTTYLNDRAYEALTTGTGPLPHGSIVVKENYMPDSTLAAVTVMYSAEGYDSEHNDYFWAKYTPDGGVDAAGRVEGCQSCHSVGERGYLRTPYEPDAPSADGG